MVLATRAWKPFFLHIFNINREMKARSLALLRNELHASEQTLLRMLRWIEHDAI